MKPKICCFPQQNLENGSWFLQENYRRAIVKAGGECILFLPPKTRVSREQLEGYDGYLFPGGPDVNPLFFHEDVIEGCGRISMMRDLLELSALQLLAMQKKPVLGICRGIQVMNVAFGGDVYQDLKGVSVIKHYQTAEDSVPTHRVFLSKESKLTSICQCEVLETNSFHHQSVRKIAQEFLASGRTEDGLVEAMELRGHPYYVGVQWHPEMMISWDEKARVIFEAFMTHC